MTPKPPNTPAGPLDLESLRVPLADEFSEPPLLTESLDPDEIPLLSDIVEADPSDINDDSGATNARCNEPSARQAFRSLSERHLELDLRATADMILQEVIDDFVPQIEAELKRRLETRIERLIQPPRP